MSVTLEDIARNCGCSISTVSKALSGSKQCFLSAATRETIKLSAARMGYQPNYFARGLRYRRSTLVAVISPMFGSEIAAAQAKSMVMPLKENGYLGFFTDNTGQQLSEKELLAEACRSQAQGIILSTLSDEAEVRSILPANVPYILITHKPYAGHPCLVIDRAASMVTTVDRLVALGHRRIGFVTMSLIGAASKIEGYTKALQERGLFRPEFILGCESNDPADAVREYVLAHAGLCRAVTAICATNDFVAAGVVRALTELGIRVPEDCSVIGYDDMPVTQVTHPTMSSLRQPREEVGRHAVRMLMDRMAGKDVKSVVLVPELVERGSIGPCPKE